MRPLYLLFAACIFPALASAATPVHILKAPDNSLVPEVVMDQKGTLHMVYGLDGNAWYVRSADNGKTFTPPVKINTDPVSLTMGERGPKLAVAGDIIHVVWADKWAQGVKVFARYTRSTDGGKTFAPAKAISPMPGIDGLTLAADGDNVIAFWHVMQPVQNVIKDGTYLWLSRSKDKGVTFDQGEPMKIQGLGPLACSMCIMRARFGPDGDVYLALRTAEKNIRDFWVLRSAPDKNAFTAIRVNEDNWELPNCPMCGPELTLDPAGRLVCAFMSRHKVYWAISDEKRATFALHVATPANENNEIYPAAVANKKGEVLMVWQFGPMSVQSTAIVKWATYTADGKPTGETGTVGKSFSGTKATAFVGTDDELYVVTTGK